MARLLNPTTEKTKYPFLNKKKLILQPIIVEIHEIIKPITFPNTTVFTAINKANGKIGMIDSNIIIIIPKNKLIKMLLLYTKFVICSTVSLIICSMLSPF